MRGFYFLYYRLINNILLLVLKVLYVWLLICFEVILFIIFIIVESEFDENDLVSVIVLEEFFSFLNKGEVFSLK